MYCATYRSPQALILPPRFLRTPSFTIGRSNGESGPHHEQGVLASSRGWEAVAARAPPDSHPIDTDLALEESSRDGGLRLRKGEVCLDELLPPAAAVQVATMKNKLIVNVDLELN